MMGVLYQTVKLSHEAKMQIFIKELLMLGVTDYHGKDLDDLNYYELRQLLSVKRALTE